MTTASHTTSSRRPARWFLTGGLLATGVYFLLPNVPQSLAYEVIGLASIAAIVAGARMHRPARRRAWDLFALGLLLFVAADLVLTWFEITQAHPPAPSLADPLYLAGTAVLIGGVVVMVRGRASGPDHAALLDAGIIAVGLGVLVWAFWMDPYTHDGRLSQLQHAVSLAYPLMDILLLAGVARLALGPGQRTPAFHLLALSLALLLGADVAYGLATLHSVYDGGSLADAGWLLSYVLWGTAALHPSMRAMTAPAAPRDLAPAPGRIVALGGASLLGPLALGAQSLAGQHVDVPVLVGASGVVFLLALGRMSGLMRLVAETAAQRERALHRERTLRLAASRLVGASDRDAIHEAALEAIAAVVDGRRGLEITVWSRTADGIVPVAGTRWPRGRLELGSMPGEQRRTLLAGKAVEVTPLDRAARRALGMGRDRGVGYAVLLLLDGEAAGALTMLSRRRLDPDVRGSLCTLRDQVTLALESMERAEALQRRRGERRLAALIQHSADLILILDDGGAIARETPSGQRILGHASDELTGTMLAELIHPDDRRHAQAVLSDAWAGPGAIAPTEWRMRHRDGSWRVCESVVNNLRDAPDIGAIVVNTRDVTERRQLEDQLAHQAFHDGLTDLANRALFRERFEQAVELSRRDGDRHAVLLLDVDDFKAINDTLGHAAGDALLVGFADRLRRCCRRGDTASRLGGDEFAVLLESIDHPDEAWRAAERITAALAEPFDLGGRQVLVSASIGVVVRGADDEDAGDILRHADIAMYLAKSRGKGRFEIFEPAMHDDAMRRLELGSDLRRAVEDEEFFLQYQPIVELEGSETIGFEALVRWRHPSRGVVAPPDFIAAAEETGLIVPIGRWVLREATRQASAWDEAFPDSRPLMMNVNLSGRQLGDPDLIADVEAALRESGLPPEQLTVEITESVMISDTEATISRLREITDLGVRLAIDDFGTGYSSLSYLRRLPVQVLKIAKPFVDDLVDDRAVAAVAEGIVKLGRTLRLEVIAEGIETADQADRLRRMRCAMGQGFRFARPMGGQAVTERLAARSLRES